MDDALEATDRLRRSLENSVNLDESKMQEDAQAYADLCKEINQRLRLCNSYLDRGMHGEAIALAQTPPPLLDQAAAVEFLEADRWRQFCKETNYPYPEPIEKGIVKRLNKAYDVELPLAELRAVYRTVVYGNGGLAQRIPLLRKLAKHDAQNREELQKCEAERIKQLSKEVDAAVQARDLREMESLDRELNSDEWLVKPSGKLKRRLHGHIKSLRLEQTAKRAKAIASEAWVAHSVPDFTRTEKAVSAWERLLKKRNFQPDQDLLDSMGQVLEYYEAEKKKRQEDREFRRTVRKTQEALENEGMGLFEFEKLCFALERFKRSIDPTLASQINTRLNSLREEAERKRKLVRGLLGIAALLLVGATVWVVIAGRKERIRQDYLSRITGAVEEADFQTAFALRDQLRKNHPDIAIEPIFEEALARAAQAQEEEKHRAERFREVFNQLVSAQQSGFPRSEPVRTLMDEAEGLARTSRETAQLNRWKVAHEAHRRSQREAADRRFMGHLSKGIEALAALKDINPAKSRADNRRFRDVIARCENILGEATTIQNVSAELLARAVNFREVLQQRRAEAEQAAADLDRADALLAKIDAGAATLGQYMDALKMFVAAFPTRQESERFRRVIANSRLAAGVLDGRRWAGPMNPEKHQEANNWLASDEAKGSIWRSAVERKAQAYGMANRRQQVDRNLAMLRRNWRFTDLCTFVVEDPDKPGGKTRYYFLDRPDIERTFRIEDHVVVRYRVMVFTRGDTPEEVRVQLSRKDLDLNPQDMRTLLAPHCKLFRDIYREYQEIEDAQHLEAFLLESAERVRSHEEADPVPKALLIRYLFTQAEILTLDHQEEIGRMLERLGPPHMQTDVFWMNPEPDFEVLDAKEGIERGLAQLRELPALAEKATVRSAIYSAALERAPVFAGRVRRQNGEWGFDLAGGDPSELWLVRQSGGTPAIHVVGVFDSEGVQKMVGDQEAFVDGTPLLAPGDGRKTAEIVKEAFEALPRGRRQEIAANMRWPDCWPINVRAAALSEQGLAHAR